LHFGIKTRHHYMQQELELSVLPEQISDETHLLQRGATQLNIAPERIKGLKVRKRSIDARGKRVVCRVRIIFYIDEVPAPDILRVSYANVSAAPTVIIVGAGPAGLFAALRCLEKGLRPIVLERGKDVQERRRDLAVLNRDGIVNPDSNYCFGEGGAGTYSDGKLYTRSNKRGDVQQVLEVFVAHGATEDILVD